MGRNGSRLGRASRTLALLFVLAITTAWTPAAPAPSPESVVASRTPSLASAAIVERAARRDDAALQTQARAQLQASAPRRAQFVEDPIDIGGERPPAIPAAPVEAEDEGSGGVAAHARALTGTSRMWIPSLGLTHPVVLFPCPRQRPPDNYMYRWGCAGENNVYLLGHAHSVFKPLHDAYVEGRLRVGMLAMYADPDGRIRSYRVTEWRVVDPVDSHWAIASQPVPSMTLQTCVGKQSQWRLNVRLVAVD
jgi:Sortase domain